MTYWARWIRQPQTVWLRRAIFQVHMWSAIAVGLYVFMISVTGSVLVYRNELYRAAVDNPAGFRLRVEAPPAARRPARRRNRPPDQRRPRAPGYRHRRHRDCRVVAGDQNVAAKPRRSRERRVAALHLGRAQHDRLLDIRIHLVVLRSAEPISATPSRFRISPTDSSLPLTSMRGRASSIRFCTGSPTCISAASTASGSRAAARDSATR